MIVALLFTLGHMMLEPEEMTFRRVWPHAEDIEGAPSPDGRYLSFVDWSTGDMAVRDLESKTNRVVTSDGTWEQPQRFGDASVWSPDSRQLAYCWFEGESADLRIVDVDSKESRVLYHDPDAGYPWPRAWTPDGKFILAVYNRRDEGRPKGHEDQIALVSVEDGSLRILKSLGDHHTRFMDISPDGRFIVYDTPPDPGTEHRDIFLLAIDSGEEAQLVRDPADDWAPYWTPDGGSIVFASNRSGADGLWRLGVKDGQADGEPQALRSMGEFRPMGITRAGEYFYSTETPTSDIYVAAVDFETGQVLQPATRISQRFAGTNETATWSPDGERLLYLSRRSEGHFFVIRSMATGEEHESPGIETAIHPRGFAAPRWHPDGESVLVHGRRNATGGTVLSLLDVETGEERPLLGKEPRQIHGA